ncbi:hypothetical protein FRC04_009741 [Tulasnella sp. 424]|nr:hypothetical protein FRC04_009741 [Tulasnella sp. 424]
MPQSKSGTVKSLASRYEQENNPQPIHTRFRHQSLRPLPNDKPLVDGITANPQGETKSPHSVGPVDRDSSLGSSGLELRPLSTQGLFRRTPSSHELEESSSDDEPKQLLSGSEVQLTAPETTIPTHIQASALSRDSVGSSITATLVGTASGQTQLADKIQSSPSQLAFPKPPKPSRSIHYHKPSEPSPVGATTLFSSDAAPLSVPELDSYIESLPKVVFSGPSNDDQGKNGASAWESSKFPPFELLANRTLVDLKNNRPEPPIWKDRNALFGMVTGWVLGLMGSSAMSTYYSLQGVYDSVQIFALILSSVVRIQSERTENAWRRILLGTVPNVLALNISALTQSVIFFVVFQLVALLVVAYFHRATSRFVQSQPMHEGLLEHPEGSKGHGWGVLWASFLLITLYLPVSTIAVHALVTIYFPVRLYVAIKHALPVVDRYSELGRHRTTSELEREYQRLLVRDTHPLSFLYNEFRRAWGTYKPLYLVVKLVALLTVAVIDPNNCLFRNSTRAKVDVIRQSVLVVETSIALITQSFLSPFIDPVSNASEWTSRAGYVITSVIGLLVALNVPNNQILNGPFLYVIYALNYGLNIYFAAVNLSCIRVLIKRITRRLDFNIFSPRLNTVMHVNRRIYQESISILLLALPQCRMPPSQNLVFNEAFGGDWPPYLMDFSGSPAERHVENLKILRDVGFDAYQQGVVARYGQNKHHLKELERRIERELVGPDAYWKPIDSPVKGCSHYFGHAWWIPFPPTLVIKYDRGGVAVLTTLADLDAFVEQNAEPSIVEKRRLVGARTWLPCGGPRYKIQSTTSFRACTFEIKRRGIASWRKFQLGSGFHVELRYGPNVAAHAPVIGLDDDFSVSPLLARFLLQNQDIVSRNSSKLEDALSDYRRHLRKMSNWKHDVLTYSFLTTVYFRPNDATAIAREVEATEKDPRVRDMVLAGQAALTSTYERIRAVTGTALATWWYLFWDDFWRQNRGAFPTLRIHEVDFNPQYPTSIAYRPLSRSALERFLDYRGLLASSTRSSECLNAGILNKVYVRMSQIAFQGASRIIRTHVGGHAIEFDISEIKFGHPKTSTLDTGGGKSL